MSAFRIDEWIEVAQLFGQHVRQTLNVLDYFIWGHIKALVERAW